ncbi:hypothetical protein vseg_014888 [Gypsophila vaccaria]
MEIVVSIVCREIVYCEKISLNIAIKGFLVSDLYFTSSAFRGSGSGSEMDIVVSSVRAYLSALNKMISYQNKPDKPKVSDKNSDVSASAAVPAASI